MTSYVKSLIFGGFPLVQAKLQDLELQESVVEDVIFLRFVIHISGGL